MEKEKLKLNDKNNNNDKARQKRIIKWVSSLITILLIAGWFLIPILNEQAGSEENIKTYNEFMEYVEDGKVEQVDYDSGYQFMMFKLKEDETVYQTDNPRSATFKEDMLIYGIAVNEVDLNEVHPKIKDDYEYATAKLMN